jgi:prepilin-type N-terminal cleavage/methylation domain-containing protein
MTAAAGKERVHRDQGFGLVEVIVAMGLFGLLTTVLLGFALGTGRVTEDTRMLAGVNEESRLAMERFARELRQAREITAYTRPSPADPEVAFTFWTDFDGDDVEDLGVVDPEVLTYRWTPDNNRLTLTANDADGSAVTRPVLAANVSQFEIELFSSLWEHDANGDGMTSWLELDAAVGGDDGVPEEADLQYVDLVTVTMTVLDGPHSQTYRTEVDLRNRNQN